MSDLTVSRWTKYGHDRLYVTGVDGTRVGWRDLKTGCDTIEVDQFANEFRLAVDAYLAPSAMGHGDSTVVATDVPLPKSHSADPGDDLALNRPGQGARGIADKERADLQERSKALAFVARALDLNTDERSWRVGAVGEEAVGKRLEKLKERGWFVLHSIPVGKRGSDIDHLVICPGGVYPINAKRHPNKEVVVNGDYIRVDGHLVPYVRNSVYEGDRVGKILTAAVGWDVPVRPVIVFLTASVFAHLTIKKQPDSVAVLERMDVPGFWTRAPKRLDAGQMAELFEVARRPSTWKV